MRTRGKAMHKRQSLAAAGVSITITDGTYSVTLNALIGQTKFVSGVESGAYMEYSERDYIVWRADLVLNSATREPSESMRISESINGTTMYFKPTRPSNVEEPAWRYTDGDRDCYRIHTKRIYPAV